MEPERREARYGKAVQGCNHPLAARRISVVEGRLVTTCWACAVEKEIDHGR